VPPERSLALRDAFRRAESIGPVRPAVVGFAGGILASYAADAYLPPEIGAPVRQILGAVAFVAAMAPLWLFLQPAEVRRALDVLTWLNGWETERWQTEIGRRLTAIPRATPGMVDTLPDTMGLRPLRVELLAADGRPDEARERLGGLPTDTPWQRFERASLAEWIAWWTDAPAELAPMHAAASEITDDERRLAARVMVAAAEARRAAVARGDAMTPLAMMRDELGDRPRRYAFGYTAGVLGAVGLMGIVASITITVGANIIR
jgi:hypothetical protein